MKIFLLILLVNSFFQNVYAEVKDFRQLRSSHFIINYQEGVERSYLTNIKQKAEDFYKKITQEFHLVRDELWLWDNRAKIFVARDRKEYLDNFNCPNWSAACLDYRAKKVYTYPGQKYFISTLAHELTHIIFREYIKRQDLPLWLDEGMAMYIETKFSDSRYQVFSGRIKKMIKDNSFIPFKELTELNTRTMREKPDSYVNTFYLQSFSLINFIIGKYKKHHFSQFLWNFKNESNFRKALSKTYYQLKSLKDLEERWKTYYLK
ncbi:MAG: hypothetical protein K9L69_00185 [Candidatus Omnitrophica bacterium]|nr:hypothetical protein [Candidatus Omnitrophota bacterium]MCF7894547.1 hypothetical protein [Candidatus Omnitrophota bacterium]